MGALLRRGRFDGQVEIPLPNQLERTAILATHAGSRHLATAVDLTAISRGAPGFWGDDLANLINEATIVAVRHNRDVIVANDLDEARDRILLGPRESSNALSLGTNGPSPLTRPDTPWWRTTSMRSAHDG